MKRQFITNDVPKSTASDSAEAFASEFVALLKKHGLDPSQITLTIDDKPAVNSDITSRYKLPADGWAADLAPDPLPSKGAATDDVRSRFTPPTDPDDYANLAPEA
mgnify:CR=1 FL=1